jgi:Tfp pilus assembly protein PilO
MNIERKQVLLIAVIAAMVAGFAMLLYRPLHNRIKAVRAGREARVIATAQAKSNMEQIPALKSQLASLESQVRDFDARIPAGRGLGSFLQSLTEAMNSHNLKDQVIVPDAEIAMEGVVCIPVKIQCSGTVHEIFAFLKSMQAVERLMRIERVEVKNGPELNGMLTMAAQVNIYYRK